MLEWITNIITKNTDADGKVDVEAIKTELKAEAPNHVIPKDQYNTVSEQLKTAKETIDGLKQSNTGLESLQQDVKTWEEKYQKLETEFADSARQNQLKEVLRKAGASDIDYMMFKLGDIEVNKDGSIRDLDNKVKSLKENNPTFFASKQPDASNGDQSGTTPTAQGGQNLGGYKPIDNRLNEGKAPTEAQQVEQQFRQALGIAG